MAEGNKEKKNKRREEQNKTPKHNTSTHQHINTSTHQHINTSTQWRPCLDFPRASSLAFCSTSRVRFPHSLIPSLFSSLLTLNVAKRRPSSCRDQESVLLARLSHDEGESRSPSPETPDLTTHQSRSHDQKTFLSAVATGMLSVTAITLTTDKALHIKPLFPVATALGGVILGLGMFSSEACENRSLLISSLDLSPFDLI